MPGANRRYRMLRHLRALLVIYPLYLVCEALMAVPTRVCADCATPISRQATRCRACSVRNTNASPDVAAARKAAIRAKFAEPAHLAKMQGVARRAGEIARQDPEFRARLVEHGKRMYATHLNTPEGRAKVLATRKASGAKRTETVLGWCPPEYRDDYRRLIYSKQVRAVEARRIILDLIEAKRAKPRVLSPFEKQDLALFKGVPIVANVRVVR